MRERVSSSALASTSASARRFVILNSDFRLASTAAASRDWRWTVKVVKSLHETVKETLFGNSFIRRNVLLTRHGNKTKTVMCLFTRTRRKFWNTSLSQKSTRMRSLIWPVPVLAILVLADQSSGFTGFHSGKRLQSIFLLNQDWAK